MSKRGDYKVVKGVGPYKIYIVDPDEAASEHPEVDRMIDILADRRQSRHGSHESFNAAALYISTVPGQTTVVKTDADAAAVALASCRSELQSRGTLEAASALSDELSEVGDILSRFKIDFSKWQESGFDLAGNEEHLNPAHREKLEAVRQKLEAGDTIYQDGVQLYAHASREQSLRHQWIHMLQSGVGQLSGRAYVKPLDPIVHVCVVDATRVSDPAETTEFFVDSVSRMLEARLERQKEAPLEVDIAPSKLNEDALWDLVPFYGEFVEAFDLIAKSSDGSYSLSSLEDRLSYAPPRVKLRRGCFGSPEKACKPQGEGEVELDILDVVSNMHAVYQPLFEEFLSWRNRRSREISGEDVGEEPQWRYDSRDLEAFFGAVSEFQNVLAIDIAEKLRDTSLGCEVPHFSYRTPSKHTVSGGKVVVEREEVNVEVTDAKKCSEIFGDFVQMFKEVGQDYAAGGIDFTRMTRDSQGILVRASNVAAALRDSLPKGELRSLADSLASFQILVNVSGFGNDISETSSSDSRSVELENIEELPAYRLEIDGESTDVRLPLMIQISHMDQVPAGEQDAVVERVMQKYNSDTLGRLVYAYVPVNSGDPSKVGIAVHELEKANYLLSRKGQQLTPEGIDAAKSEPFLNDNDRRILDRAYGIISSRDEINTNARRIYSMSDVQKKAHLRKLGQETGMADALKVALGMMLEFLPELSGHSNGPTLEGTYTLPSTGVMISGPHDVGKTATAISYRLVFGGHNETEEVSYAGAGREYQSTLIPGIVRVGGQKNFSGSGRIGSAKSEVLKISSGAVPDVSFIEKSLSEVQRNIRDALLLRGMNVYKHMDV